MNEGCTRTIHIARHALNHKKQNTFIDTCTFILQHLLNIPGS